MRKPAYLEKGNTIEMVAPSFGETSSPYFERFEKAIERLSKAGYPIKIGRNVYLSEGEVASATARDRGEEFMEAYLNPDSSLIISVAGGELMDEMLPYVDFEAIRHAKPKWFMGFSDNTNLTFLLPILSDVATIYGPCATAFYEKPWRCSTLDAMRMLKGEKHFVSYPKFGFGKQDEPDPLKKIRYNRKNVIKTHGMDKPVRGTLLGGCLDCIVSLVGTKYDKVKEFAQGKKLIFFLEACDLTPLQIRRALFQLREAGWFENVAMFIFGRPNSIPPYPFDFSFEDAIGGIIGPIGVPYLTGMSLGHINPSMPIMTGVEAEVSYENNQVTIDYID